MYVSGRLKGWGEGRSREWMHDWMCGRLGTCMDDCVYRYTVMWIRYVAA